MYPSAPRLSIFFANRPQDHRFTNSFRPQIAYQASSATFRSPEQNPNIAYATFLDF